MMILLSRDILIFIVATVNHFWSPVHNLYASPVSAGTLAIAM